MFHPSKFEVGCFVLAAALVGFRSTVSQASGSIGINFDGGPDQGTPSPLAPTDVAGVIPQQNWNNEATKAGGPSALVSSSGAATAATVTWNSGNTWTNNDNTNFSGPNNALLGNYLDGGSGGTATVTVANVPYSRYDLYIYTERDGGATSDYTVNGVTQTVQVAGAGFYNANGFVLDTPTTTGDYLEFTGLTASTINLIASQVNTRSPVDGIEIVNTAVPEPSSVVALIGLCGMGLTAFLIRRRRKA